MHPRSNLSKSLNWKFNQLSESFLKSTTTPGPNPCARVRSVGIVRKRISGASSNDHTISKRRVSEGPLFHKPAQSTELACLQQQGEREGVEFGGAMGIETEMRCWRGRWMGKGAMLHVH